MKIKISTLLRVVVSLSLLGFLFWIMRGEFSRILKTIYRCEPGFFFFGIVLFLLNVCVLAVRLKIIFLGESLEISLGRAVQLTFIGYFFNNFMPTAVGGDIVKAHYASMRNNKKVQSYASVLMDRFIGLFTFMIVAFFALTVNYQAQGMDVARKMIYMFLFLGVAFLLVVTNRRVELYIQSIFKRIKMFSLGERLNAIYNIIQDYKNRKDVVFRAILVSLAAQSIYFCVVFLFFRALRVEIGLNSIFLIMPVVTFITMVPSMGGLGVREGAIVAFFTPLAGKENAFAASLLVLFGLYFISVIGGALYLWWGVGGMLEERKNRGRQDEPGVEGDRSP